PQTPPCRRQAPSNSKPSKFPARYPPVPPRRLCSPYGVGLETAAWGAEANNEYGNDPTTAAAIMVASVPANSVFQASARKSGRLSGAMIDRPPIRMPIEPKLAKPQMA